MAATCGICSDTLEDAAHCIIPECPHRAAALASPYKPSGSALPAPPRPSAIGRATPSRRLLAAGPEFLILMGLEIVSAIFVPVGVAISSFIALYVATRDISGGRFHVGKRLARVRVVDAATGLVPTHGQAVLRNAPYILGWLIAVIPGLELVGWGLLLLSALVDVGLVLADPLGRRLGDRLARTKVINGHPNEGDAG
jgi:hypothetical protein